MLKKLNIICLFIMCVILGIGSGSRAEEEMIPDALQSPELRQAAGEGLTFFLGMLPEAGQDQYGFLPEDALDEAGLGSAFRLLTATPTALTAYRKGDPVSFLLTETSMVYFPVVIGGDIRALLLMDLHGGMWRAVGLGYPRLARTWAGILRQWPEDRGYHPRLAAIFQTGEFLFSIPELDRPNLTLLAPSGEGSDDGEGNQDYSVTTDPLEVVSAIKPLLVGETRGGE